MLDWRQFMFNTSINNRFSLTTTNVVFINNNFSVTKDRNNLKKFCTKKDQGVVRNTNLYTAVQIIILAVKYCV